MSLNFESLQADSIINDCVVRMREAGGFMLVMEIESIYGLSREDAVIVRNSAEHQLRVEDNQ